MMTATSTGWKDITEGWLIIEGLELRVQSAAVGAAPRDRIRTWFCSQLSTLNSQLPRPHFSVSLYLNGVMPVMYTRSPSARTLPPTHPITSDSIRPGGREKFPGPNVIVSAPIV